MGKFDGVLIASDYDNTLAYTAGAMESGGDLPPLSAANREAICHFMAQGGRFSVCTGRALASFLAVKGDLPTNAPAILSNGAAIYDLERGSYLYTDYLPPEARHCVAQVLSAHPHVAAEVYHEDAEAHILQPNEVTHRHLKLTRLPLTELHDAQQLPLPICKVLFEAEPSAMPELRTYIAAQPWSAQYETVLSNPMLLELTAKNADKGTAVCRLAKILGCDMAHVYCAGDQANDLPMLRRSAIPFAPANAIETVLQMPGLHILPDCRDDAIAAMVAELEKIY